MQTGYAAVDDGLLYYETAGGVVLPVMIHAGFLDRRRWDEYFQLFSKTRKITPAMMCAGSASRTLLRARSQIMEDLHALLEFLRVESASIMGVSNGWRIALDFAVEHAKEGQSLILVSLGVSG